jgi:hypothetical protein
MNSIKTGLDAESLFVKGESREEFALLQSEWYTFHAPANPEERYQVDNLIRCEWLQRRQGRPWPSGRRPARSIRPDPSAPAGARKNLRATPRT